ncbi:MAG TPA: septum site-determining protein MinC [Aggregatilineaceae bacterium]|jgi:septum site-determining protein MinC|nr:septum site-determining protein MinC [Anaerolineae bacterium]HMM28677.1 septum site-determining protein MinC [Aggregatilineaceae bacterium]
MDDSITLKGIKQGLLVTIKPEGRWSDLTARLMSLIDAQSAFFRGAQIAVAVGPREVRRHELASLIKLLEKRDVALLAVLGESAATVGSARKLGLKTALSELELESPEEAPEAQPEMPPPIDPEEYGTGGVLIKRTLRNGRVVHSDGHVVVVGDVNAGAVIVARGDVIVWGRLRGTVHAGSGGDESAVVCALNLTPTQLRIASYITISPEEGRQKPRPEKALVRNGRIEAEAWEA